MLVWKKTQQKKKIEEEVMGNEQARVNKKADQDYQPLIEMMKKIERDHSTQN